MAVALVVVLVIVVVVVVVVVVVIAAAAAVVVVVAVVVKEAYCCRDKSQLREYVCLLKESGLWQSRMNNTQKPNALHFHLPLCSLCWVMRSRRSAFQMSFRS